jgi:hypothetical protein
MEVGSSMISTKPTMQKILETVRAKNPYPEDVFTEPTKEEYIIVQKLFKNAGLSQDRFFGAYGRRVWENCICTFEQLIIAAENEKIYKLINDAKKHIDKDPHLSNYILRDLNVVKEAGLADLSWSMHKQGCTKGDVEYLILQIERYLAGLNS